MAALVLASASPRRAELLQAAGIPFEVDAADIDETRRPDEAAADYVARLAVEKARAVQARRPGRVILAADTAVVAGTQVLGKPADAADASRMLHLLSGGIHFVLTGVCVVAPGHLAVDVGSTAVEFRELTKAEIAWYVASREPMDKAGAYAIQGLASRFVSRIDGSYSNVVGLPVELAARMCARAGLLLF